MPTAVKCPNCNHSFDIEEVFSAELDQKYQKDYQDKLNSSLRKLESERNKFQEDVLLFEEKKKKENELFAQKLQQERQKLESELRKSIVGDYENEIRLLRENSKESEMRLKQAREKELDYLKKEQELKTREEELEIITQKKLNEEREKLVEEIRRLEEEKNANRESQHQLEVRELKKQLEDQKKLAEEAVRKAEQGSSQLQGETQELLLEEILKSAFPFDSITEVGKGVEGADCIMTVRDRNGNECGKIIFESKRTKSWSNHWVEKLKHDMRSKQADLAILVSQVYPKGMECFGERDGVWIASFKEVIHLTTALRNAIIRIAETRKSEENKGEKMQMLYNYLTGIEFRQHIEAVVEGFLAMKQSINKERIQMEKMWKEREKQLDKVLLNTSGLYGSIKGIAGASVQEIPLLENSNGEEEHPEEN